MIGWLAAFGGIASVLVAVALRPRSQSESMACPRCGGDTRFLEPYLMCDDCESLVGLRLNGKSYLSQ